MVLANENAGAPSVYDPVIGTGTGAIRVSELMSSGGVNIMQAGAKGGGYDDTAAIQAALNQYDLVYVPAGIFTINELRIPKGKELILHNKAVLQAMQNKNVITIEPGGKLSGGGTIQTDNLLGFSFAAIYIDSLDYTGNLEVKSMIQGITLQGKKNEGYGIHILSRYKGIGVSWLTAQSMKIYGYQNGIRLEAWSPIVSGSCWITGNVFDNIELVYCTYGIYIAATSVFDTGNSGMVDSNYFTNITGQCADANHTFLYCEGSLNYFKCFPFDFVKEYEFAPQSRGNVFETLFGRGLDKGAKNQVKPVGNFPANGVLNHGHVNQPSFSGMVDDYFAYADKRFTVTQTGTAPNAGTLSTIFSYPKQNGFEERRRDAYLGFPANTTGNPVVITITFPTPVSYFELFAIQFIWGTPKNVKIEANTQSFGWISVFEKTNNVEEICLSRSIDPIMSVSAVRYTLSDTAAFNINRIYGYNSHYLGGTFLPREGGIMFGNMSVPSMTIQKGTSPGTPNTFFVDQSDNKLKWIDNAGTVRIVNIT